MINYITTKKSTHMSNFLPSTRQQAPSVKCFKEATNKTLLIEECMWAVEYPELQKACFLARICAKKPPVKCKFYNIGSILQVGPTCGLTALRMLLGGMPPAEQLLHEAQEKHFTYNGEMFSAYNLYKLVCDNLPMINNNNINQTHYINANGAANYKQQTTNAAALQADVIECQMHEGLLNCAKVKENLEHGACIFVPYPFYKHICMYIYK